MSSKIYKVPEDFAALAHLKHADYLRLYQESVRDPHAFWSRIGRRLDWIQPYSKVKDTSFEQQDFRIRWFYDGKLNVAANCLDRHLTKRGDKTAILWEGDDLNRRVILHFFAREQQTACGFQAADGADIAEQAEERGAVLDAGFDGAHGS